jgi:hypothetical protein
MVQASDGRKFHGEAVLYIFEDLKRKHAAIKQFQVCQLIRGNFLVRIVPASDYDQEIGQAICAAIRENIDEAAEITIDLVDEIKREKSGKMRLVVGLPPQ